MRILAHILQPLETATILCRLRANTPELRSLCGKLKNHLKNNGGQVFQLRSPEGKDTTPFPKVTEKDLSVADGPFQFPVNFTFGGRGNKISIHFQGGFLPTSEENLPCISGFPCTLSQLTERHSESILNFKLILIPVSLPSHLFCTQLTSQLIDLTAFFQNNIERTQMANERI